MGYLGDHFEQSQLSRGAYAVPARPAVLAGECDDRPGSRLPGPGLSGPGLPGPGLPGALLSAYVEAAHQVEIDPFLQLRRQRLPTRGFEDERLAVPLGDFVAVIERTALLAGCADFALRLAAATSVPALGPVALLAYAQSTVRDAIALICARVGEAEGPLRAILVEHGDDARLQLSGAGVSQDCAADLPPALAVRVVQGLLGPAWRPARTELTRARPADAGPYEAFFGEVRFEQGGDAISFPRAELDRRSPLASPPLARLIEQHLRLREDFPEAPFADQVAALIETLLPRGLCSIEIVAEQLHVHRRTVHRRLADEGLSFRAMEAAARQRVVEAELGDLRRPVSAIARSAGFASVAAFSRWFSGVYGGPPRTCRGAQLAALVAGSPQRRPVRALSARAPTRSE